ncbi:MAG: hypothetical protein R2800_09880 [Flavipsychrobacter sp.]
MAKKDKEKNLARELFLYTNKTQKEIAEIVDVNTKTMSQWVSDGEWETIKKMQQQTPERIINDLYKELDEINSFIKNKEEGKRYADSKEADARNKIISSIKGMVREVALPQYVQVIVKLMDYLQRHDLATAKALNPHANDFLLAISADTNNQ